MGITSMDFVGATGALEKRLNLTIILLYFEKLSVDAKVPLHEFLFSCAFPLLETTYEGKLDDEFSSTCLEMCTRILQEFCHLWVWLPFISRASPCMDGRMRQWDGISRHTYPRHSSLCTKG